MDILSFSSGSPAIDTGVRDAVAAPRADAEAKPTIDVKIAADAAATTTQPKAADAKPSIESLKQAIESINQSFRNSNRSLEFRLDQETKKTVITVKDRDSGEVLRQYPPEDVLAISRYIGSVQRGLLVSSKA